MNRLTRFAASIAALAALAVGGSAFAAASQTNRPSSPPPTTTTQSVEGQPSADGDNVQQGDQSGSDNAGQAESATSETAASDGPGGYADTNPNADTQQTGEH